MKPGRELDALVAEKVMGWMLTKATKFDGTGIPSSPESFPSTTEHIVLIPPGFLEFAQPGMGLKFEEVLKWVPPVFPEVPHYSTCLECAWKVSERVDQKGKGWILLRLLQDGRYNAFMEDKQIPKDWSVIGDSAPHAICLAALKAVGWKEGDE